MLLGSLLTACASQSWICTSRSPCLPLCLEWVSGFITPDTIFRFGLIVLARGSTSGAGVGGTCLEVKAEGVEKFFGSYGLQAYDAAWSDCSWAGGGLTSCPPFSLEREPPALIRSCWLCFRVGQTLISDMTSQSASISKLVLLLPELSQHYYNCLFEKSFPQKGRDSIRMSPSHRVKVSIWNFHSPHPSG